MHSLDKSGSRRSRWFSGLLWAVPSALLLALAGVAAVALRGGPKAGEHIPSVSGGAFPRRIEAGPGETAVIPQRPVRIAAGDAGCADLLAELVEPERIAAVPSTVREYSNAGAFFREHPGIRQFEKYSSETLLALKPDLVLAGSFSEPATSSALKQAHIPVLICDSYRTLAGVRAWIGAAGLAAGEEARALKLQQDFDRRLRAVAAALAGRPRPRLLAYTNYGQGFAIGTGESQDEIIRLAGASNALAELKLAGHVNFSFEQILKLNPDCLLLTGQQGLESPQVKVLLNEPVLAGLPALKNRRIAVVPDRLLFALSHHVAEAVELLARQLHPDAFPQRGAQP